MRKIKDPSGLTRVLHRPQHKQQHNKPPKLKHKKLRMLRMPAKAAVEDLRLSEVASQVLVSLESPVLTSLISFSTTTSGKYQCIFNSYVYNREQQ